MFNEVTSYLNRNCHCVGTNIHTLRRRLDPAIGDTLETSHPHLFSELPVFVSEHDQWAMQEIIRAIESVTSLPAYREVAFKSAPDVAAIEGRPSAGLLGYDFHLTDNGPRLIEINTNPGGALLMVEMLKAQQQCCDLVDRYLDAPHQPLDVERQIVETFRMEWTRARGTAPLRSIAIIDDSPISQFLYPEFLLFKTLFERHGIQTTIASPSQLHLKNRKVFINELPIDLIYNRLTDFKLSSESNSVLREALIADAAVVTPNPAAYALCANKANLETLTDRNALESLGVAGTTIDALLRGIPKTLSVKTADAAEWWSKRKGWFFKPTDGFGSKGGYRGDKVTRGTFADIVRGGYVAQNIALPAERTQLDGALLKFDVRNYVYDGKIILSGARLYQGQTTNFRTAGGGFAPIYTLTADSHDMC